jgi:holin-like protein
MKNMKSCMMMDIFSHLIMKEDVRMKWIKILVQVCLITLFFFMGNELSPLLHLPVPGSILGMIFLFLALKAGVVRIQWVESGGNFLLGEMLLFFIPPVVGIINYEQLMKIDGWQFLVVILVSTILVMGTTGLVAEWIARKRGIRK